MIEKTLKKEVLELYSPKNAFGNAELLSKLGILANIQKEKEERKNCRLCDSNGQIEEICDQCAGTGEMKVMCEHE